MGGRGASSGISKATPQQMQKINNIKRVVAKNGYENLDFKYRSDGVVAYSYENTKIIHHVHASKMQDERKNDVYERVEKYSGTIKKDGLIVKNKTIIEDELIRKGKR